MRRQIWILGCSLSLSFCAMANTGDNPECQSQLTFEGVATPRTESKNSVKAAGSRARLEAYRMLVVALARSKACREGVSIGDVEVHALDLGGPLHMIYTPIKNEFDGKQHTFTIRLSESEWQALADASASWVWVVQPTRTLLPP